MGRACPVSWKLLVRFTLIKVFGWEECDDTDAMGNTLSGFGGQERWCWLWCLPQSPECELWPLCPMVVVVLEFSLEQFQNVVECSSG